MKKNISLKSMPRFNETGRNSTCFVRNDAKIKNYFAINGNTKVKLSYLLETPCPSIFRFLKSEEGENLVLLPEQDFVKKLKKNNLLDKFYDEYEIKINFEYTKINDEK